MRCYASLNTADRPHIADGHPRGAEGCFFGDGQFFLSTASQRFAAFSPKTIKCRRPIDVKRTGSVSTNFRRELVEPSAREVFIFWTLVVGG